MLNILISHRVEHNFKEKDYEIIDIIDNPIFNSEKVKEPSVDTNQFSIIVKKK